mmetsp:Transcript_48705/g.86672  ORF Transcript_48705/g.86672 Transcript_48705/m.86672 type:complete len:87 (-) Transcript_48705:19-279(-)
MVFCGAHLNVARCHIEGPWSADAGVNLQVDSTSWIGDCFSAQVEMCTCINKHARIEAWKFSVVMLCQLLLSTYQVAELMSMMMSSP